jgi:protein-disulfide isomerase
MPTQNQPAVLSVSVDDDPVKGNSNAPVTIIEFSDFQCPFCSRFAQQTLPLIEENYIQTGKVKLVYRDLPLSFHQNAKAAHIASECANEQGAFWKYHDELFAKQNEWQSLGADAASEKFLAYAQELGISKDEFSSCTVSSALEQEVLADFMDGTKYGATGTPTFFIGNEKHGFTKIVGAQPYEAFTSVIDSKLG